MRLGWLVLLVACACGKSHLTIPDAATDAVADDGGVDSTIMVDASSDARDGDVDAWVDGAPALPPLLGGVQHGRWLELSGIELDGSVELLYEAEIGDQVFRSVVPSPDGRFVLVTLDRFRSFDPIEFESVAFIVDLVARDTPAEPMAAIARLDGSGVCERAINFQRRFTWRRDGRAVYVACERSEEIDGAHTLVEAAVFEVGVDDTARALGTDCVSLAMPTETEPLLIHGCTEGSYSLGDTPFPIGDRVVHSWSNGMALTSILELEGSTFRYFDLAWLSPDNRESIDATLPTGSMLLAVSPRGDVPIGYRPPDTPTVESVRILTRAGESIDTDLPPCTQRNGVPELVRWAPDSSGFTAWCREGTFIVRRDGSIAQLQGTAPHFVEPVADLRWSPDARHVLRTDWLGSFDYRHVIHDSATGEPIAELESLDAETRVRWRVGEATPGCGPLTVCGF